MFQRVEIFLSKGKIIRLLLASGSFVLVGIWLVIYTPLVQKPLLSNPTFIKTIGWLSILAFGLSTLFLIVPKLFDRKPGLIIDNQGITDNSSAFAQRLILWEDVVSVTSITVYKQHLIMLQVRNPQHFIEKEKNIIKRKILSELQVIWNTFEYICQ